MHICFEVLFIYATPMIGLSAFILSAMEFSIEFEDQEEAQVHCLERLFLERIPYPKVFDSYRNTKEDLFSTHMQPAV